jgi:hypothetical protein
MMSSFTGVSGLDGVIARFAGLTMSWMVMAWILSALLPRPTQPKVDEPRPKRRTRPTRLPNLQPDEE